MRFRNERRAKGAVTGEYARPKINPGSRSKPALRSNSAA